MKQAIIVRKDLKLSKGKLAAQVAHASLKSYLVTDEEKRDWWDANDYTKIILKCETEEDLHKLQEQAEKNNISSFLVYDLGYTEIPPNTITCLGLGPDRSEKIDNITSDLKLY